MQSLQNAAAKALNSSMSSPALSPDGGPVPLRWVEDLFARLSAILGGSMSNVYASADPERVKAEWAEALGGYSADEVKRGIAATRIRKFPPNLPEFLHLCRPALDAETAWFEAEAGMASHGKGEAFAWSHPAVYWAARQVQFELRSSRFAECRKRWERLMADEWAKGAWCAPPDPTQKALPAPAAEVARSPEAAAARRRLGELRRELAGKPSPADEAFHAAFGEYP